jgi:capsule polysaccharide export protein KpsC/LpsZ
VFPDFYEWIQFLGEISNQTDYDWYIKTHPDYLPGTKEIIDDFIARFPRFVLLPSNASHLQIINEGIDFALTVYGTIGFEYAALGIPVINNSPNNPHIAYDFNIHTKNVTEYREALMSLDSLDFQIDKQQVYQYYFMRNVFNTNDLFFDDFDKVVDKIGGYEQQFFPDIYREWLDVWTPEKHAEIKAGLTAFIDSQDFRMDYRHLGREFALKTVEDVA